jgi:hypothetical protein
LSQIFFTLARTFIVLLPLAASAAPKAARLATRALQNFDGRLDAGATNYL